MTDEERREAIAATAAKIFARTIPTPDSTCVHWAGPVQATGYAHVGFDGSAHLAHRLVAEHVYGPIPDGMQVDHVCHSVSEDCYAGVCEHRRCLNPKHLEIVTPKQNSERGWLARRRVCGRGHPFDEKNTGMNGRHRRCRRCHADNETARRNRRALAAANIRSAA